MDRGAWWSTQSNGSQRIRQSEQLIHTFVANRVSHLQSLSLGPLVSLITGMEQDLPRRAQLV